MRNSDTVNFIGFSTGGKGCNGTKVRFTCHMVRFTKVLQKNGANNIVWHSLPKAMIKADAVNYLQQQSASLSLDQVQQEAVARASNRLIPKTKPARATTKNK